MNMKKIKLPNRLNYWVLCWNMGLYAGMKWKPSKQNETPEQEPITGVEIAMLNGLMGYCDNRCNKDFVLYAYEYFRPTKIAQYMVLYGYIYESALEWIMETIEEEGEPAPPLTYEELEIIEELKADGILYSGDDVEAW